MLFGEPGGEPPADVTTQGTRTPLDQAMALLIDLLTNVQDAADADTAQTATTTGDRTLDGQLHQWARSQGRPDITPGVARAALLIWSRVHGIVSLELTGMFAGQKPSLDGTWYQVKEEVNSPAPLGKIPIMIGGGGEKKTLRLVAQYADESNLICGVDEIPRKLDALAGHCDRIGRDRSEIIVSHQGQACVAPTHEQAVAELDALFLSRGMDVSSMSDDECSDEGTGEDCASE
jgi:hypothetical protein